MSIRICIIALVTALAMSSPAQSRVIGSHKEFTASVADNFTCSEVVDVKIAADSPTAFQDNPSGLSKMVGLVRMAMGFDCPQAKKINIAGFHDGKQIVTSAASKSTDWRLEPLQQMETISTSVQNNSQEGYSTFPEVITEDTNDNSIILIKYMDESCKLNYACGNDAYKIVVAEERIFFEYGRRFSRDMFKLLGNNDYRKTSVVIRMDDHDIKLPLLRIFKAHLGWYEYKGENAKLLLTKIKSGGSFEFKLEGFNHIKPEWIRIDFPEGKKVATKSLETAPATIAPVAELPKPKLPYDINRLPEALRTVPLIPFKDGTEKSMTEKYVKRLSGNPNIDDDCHAAAYKYLRSYQYWKYLERDIETLSYDHQNNDGKYSGTTKNFPKITQKNASEMCNNKEYITFFQDKTIRKPHGVPEAFNRLCKNIEPEEQKNYKPVNLPSNFNICYATDFIAKSAYNNCKSDSNRSDIQTPGLSAEKYCQCVGSRQAQYFATGNVSMSSKTLVQTGTIARLVCDNHRDSPKLEERYFIKK
tara:strand:+ start:7521 stop:9110 length:1590 start_codon:yes stop_codon:yes gene_type:complete